LAFAFLSEEAVIGFGVGIELGTIILLLLILIIDLSN
jgi:hypothetical protein